MSNVQVPSIEATFVSHSYNMYLAASLSVHAAVSQCTNQQTHHHHQQSVQLLSDFVTTKHRYFSIWTFGHNYQNTNPHLILITLTQTLILHFIVLFLQTMLLIVLHIVILWCYKKQDSSQKPQPMPTEERLSLRVSFSLPRTAPATGDRSPNLPDVIDGPLHGRY